MSDGDDQAGVRWRGVLSALAAVNGRALQMRWRRSPEFRAYLSETVRRGEELLGRGLPARDPVRFLLEEWDCQPAAQDRVCLPPRLTDAGGTSVGELALLAAVTLLLQPRVVFEIGTFNGRTTTVFLMNSPEAARVYSLDLPPAASGREAGGIDTDRDLVRRRKLAAYVYEHGLEARFAQLLGDSLQFDPAPYQDRVELGFIDGAHEYAYVRNDTEKMARMMAGRGLVFWHDYGGRGRFGPLSAYLEALGRRITLYRVPGTTLAWTTATALRQLRER